jgi:hypothetical protein
MIVARGAVRSFLLAVATAACGEAPAAAPPPKAAEAVDLSPAAWEAAARKVEWRFEQRIIRCLGTDTAVTVPPAWVAHVEVHSEGDVQIRTGPDGRGVLLVRAKADGFALEDFARDFVDGLDALGERPPNEATITLDITKNGHMTGLLTTPPEILAAADFTFRYRLAVVQRRERSCRIFALASVSGDDPESESDPMIRLAESAPASSLGEIAGAFTFRTLGQIVGAVQYGGSSQSQ